MVVVSFTEWTMENDDFSTDNLNDLQKARRGIADPAAFAMLSEELHAMADGAKRYPELQNASQQARDLWRSAADIVTYARKTWWRRS